MGEATPMHDLQPSTDALQDFMRPQPPKAAEAPTAPSAPVTTDLASMVAAAGISAATVGKEGQAGAGEMWTEEFVQQATSQFEQTMRMLMQQQQQKEQQEQQGKSTSFHTYSSSVSVFCYSC